MRARALVFFAAALLPAPLLQAQTEDVGAGQRFRAVLNGAFAPASLSFQESRRFTEFAETGTLDASYKDDAGPGLDLGLQYNFAGRVGVMAGLSKFSRSGGGSFTATLPHPLYFNQLRRAEGNFDGYDYLETALHLDLVASKAKGAIEFVVFAGATRFDVKTDVVDTLQYSHSYPYDSVTITSVPKKRQSQSPTGFNVGGRLDYGLGRAKRVGLGLQVRYSRASVQLAPVEGSSIKLDVGGLHVGLGARLFF
jgi:hypothetical protein